MKLTVIPSFTVIAAIAAVSTAPERAEAFDTGRAYQVYIFNGLQKIDTGKLRSDLFEYVDDNGHEACSYFAMWDGDHPLFFDERVAPGYLDCDVNSTISFPTLIVNSPDYENSGINKSGEGKSILNMVLIEGADGSAFGIIVFDENRPYPLLIEPSEDRSPTHSTCGSPIRQTSGAYSRTGPVAREGIRHRRQRAQAG